MKLTHERDARRMDRTAPPMIDASTGHIGLRCIDETETREEGIPT